MEDEQSDPRTILCDELLKLGLSEEAASLIALEAGSSQGTVERGDLDMLGVEDKALQDKILFLIMRFEMGEFGGGWMRAFIFVTDEGHTYQPNSVSSEPDVDNFQVLGFASGEDEEQAFENLVTKNEWLLSTTFDEVQCFELRYPSYFTYAKYFYLKDRLASP